MTNQHQTIAELRVKASVVETTEERANVLLVLAKVLEQQGYPHESLTTAEESYMLGVQIGDMNVQTESLRLQGGAHFRMGAYPNALECFNRSLAIAQIANNRLGIAKIISNIGLIYRNIGEYPKALEQHQSALMLFEELNDRTGVAIATGNIGNVYENLGDPLRALEYWKQALEIHEELNNRSSVALIKGNIGTAFAQLGEYETSLQYLMEVLIVHQQMNARGMIANVLGTMANIYRRKKEYNLALMYAQQTLALYQELNHREKIITAMLNIGALYAEREFPDFNFSKAEEYLLSSIKLGEELGVQRNLAEACKVLGELYERHEQWQQAAGYFKRSYLLREIIQSEEAQEKAYQLERQRAVTEIEKRTTAERADAEATRRILHNVLPPEIAQRVVHGEERIAESFPNVTVLFADIVEFTRLSQQLSAHELVEGLDHLFSQFDELAGKHGLEKIKTIGDAYMAVAGVPQHRADHAEAAAYMALDMLQVINDFETKNIPEPIQLRIGLHSGEVVAGIIGKKKFAYDLWGDTVNTASRMESHGIAGKIHVSADFAEALQRKKTILADSTYTSCLSSESRTVYQLPITLQERGDIEIKGKGMMKTFFLEPL